MDLKKHIQAHKSEFDDRKVSAMTDEVFKRKLKKTLHQENNKSKGFVKYLSIAASILLIMSTLFFVYNQQEKNNEKRNMLLAGLEDNSTGKRLEAVYEFSDVYKKEDEKIIEVLIKTLLNDTNSNVKIATVDALLKFPQNETIRLALIEAKEKEKQPLVQIKLINSLSILREQRAQKPLEKIMNNKETFEIVKSNATLAMANLKQ